MLRDDSCGSKLTIRQFGVLMKVAAPTDHIVDYCVYLFSMGAALSRRLAAQAPSEQQRSLVVRHHLDRLIQSITLWSLTAALATAIRTIRRLGRYPSGA
ncbi:MAG: hypothetical protein CM15mP68_4670 [Pseudomonadota bacterium]|nr:MAG: hypothetical protein CM15mP68_4670 [Pseudomonadota bacterium]